MIHLFKPPILLTVIAALVPSIAGADDGRIARVQRASETFVQTFNAGDSQGLAPLYTRNGILKLPNQVAVQGRSTVAAAWQAGFDAGLSNLTLDVDVLEPVGHQRVLESGTYRLEIRTPNGVVVQTGTFAVLWKVPWRRNARPKIVFDAIDAD